MTHPFERPVGAARSWGFVLLQGVSHGAEQQEWLGVAEWERIQVASGENHHVDPIESMKIWGSIPENLVRSTYTLW